MKTPSSAMRLQYEFPVINPNRKNSSGPILDLCLPDAMEDVQHLDMPQIDLDIEDSSGPILDFNLSDAMDDMLHLEKFATVIGSVTEFHTSLMNDLPSHYWESNACYNPNSVNTIAPVSESSILTSSEAPLNLNTHNSPPLSPKEKKRHLTFSVQNTKAHISTQNILPSNSLSHQNGVTKKMKPKMTGQIYPKPPYSYSCLIGLALINNSRTSSLPVSEIYSFIYEHFPYYKTAPNGWKNSIRTNLSTSNYFEKLEGPITYGVRQKSYVWTMIPNKITKLNELIKQTSRKDLKAIRKAMACPDNLKSLLKGQMKHGSNGDSESESRDKDDMPRIDFDIEVADLCAYLNYADQEDFLSLEDLHPSMPRLDMNFVNYFE